MDNTKDTTEATVTAPTEQTVERTQVAPADTQKTAGEVIEAATAQVSRETVGLDKFLELKKENKEMKRSLKDMEARISEGASTEEISSDIRSIAQEHDVDERFLRKLASTIKAETERDLDAKYADKLKPFEEREAREKLNKVFNEHYQIAMAKLGSDFDGLVDPEEVKELSQLPRNSNKTFSEIIENRYGSLLTGKRTIDTTRPAGGKEPETLDAARAQVDSEYFQQIMQSPKLKAAYNEQMLKKGF
tara:strand:- start:658 stop:1398 length:741 start_codon:yes stop_codon:yes gene_type:complete